jgi:hypothetical protein
MPYILIKNKNYSFYKNVGKLGKRTLSQGLSDQGIVLATHPNLVLRLRKGRFIHLPSPTTTNPFPRAFTACYRAHFTLYTMCLMPIITSNIF